MMSLRESFINLLESFDYSDSVEERIRLLRSAIGRLSNIFYGTENEDIYADQVRRIKLRLNELRGKLGEFDEKTEFQYWKELMDTLEELRDGVERIAVKEGIIEK
ncbi:hypothetical protein DRO97_00830 [Archaeoglobales archaeon]|nr:MAG: hypothetical protein DRO97_00830 [Archaeoglobales archaeon]